MYILPHLDKQPRKQIISSSSRSTDRKIKKFTGRIIITNQRQERLKDWDIDLDSNFKIVKIENAILVDKSLEDDLKYVDEFILDSDYFETREEYEQYLEEHGLTDDALIELR